MNSNLSYAFSAVAGAEEHGRRCYLCHGGIKKGFRIFYEKLNDGSKLYWHPKCFNNNKEMKTRDKAKRERMEALGPLV